MFFVSKSNIPEGVGFSTFGPMHLIWLASIIVCIVAAAALYKRLNDKQRHTMRIVIGGCVVLLEIVKDIYHSIIGEFGVGYLPLHLCGQGGDALQHPVIGAALPGIGASIRTPAVARLRAISSARFVILLILTPELGWSS